MTPKKPQKLVNLIKIGLFGHGRTSGDMVGRCMPNSGPGGCPGTRVMTIFVSHVANHHMAISRSVFLSFITELLTRNPTMGIPALEDGLFAILLIFNYL